jgi:16S rRNA (guanine527-N7)-methyltransferase
MSRAAPQSVPPEQFEKTLRVKARSYSLTPERDWLALSRYLAELDRWRRAMNLTGALSTEDLTDHALESILGERLISHGERVIDIGSGAGFPGLPLAIERSDVAMVLAEPRAKRAAFLRHVVRELQLANAEVLERRVEDVGGQTFDAATIRAVGDPSGWLATARFLRPGGALIAWTTQPKAWEERLATRFRLDEILAIPGSRRRQIALYRLR